MIEERGERREERERGHRGPPPEPASRATIIQVTLSLEPFRIAYVVSACSAAYVSIRQHTSAFRIAYVVSACVPKETQNTSKEAYSRGVSKGAY